MQTFRHIILSCNSWLLTLMTAREYFPANDAISEHLDCSRLGSNDCELLFSMLCGFGSIEAGKRDGNIMELERLMGCHLTMYQNSGDRSKGHVPLGGRKREYDPDQRSMIPDEKLLGFEMKEVELFCTFTDAYIIGLLNEGTNLGCVALSRCDALPKMFRYPQRYFDYSILAFKKHLSLNPRSNRGEVVDGDDDEDADGVNDGNDDDGENDDDNDDETSVTLDVVRELRPEIQRHYGIDKHQSNDNPEPNDVSTQEDLSTQMARQRR